jgi:hypothetical protein
MADPTVNIADPTKKKPIAHGTDGSELGSMLQSAPTGGVDPNGSAPPLGAASPTTKTEQGPVTLGSTTSPVSAPPAPAPTPTPAGYNGGAAPPPGQTDPFQGQGVWTGNGWIPANNPASKQYLTNPAAGVTGPATPSTPATPSAPTPTGPDLQQTYQQALIDRLSPKTADANDASIKGAINSNNLYEQRGLENQRRLLAENAARGGEIGPDQAQVLGLQQDSAMRQGQFAGNAVQHLQDMYNDNATSALGQAGQQLTAQQQMALQRQLSGDQLSLQRELGTRDADLRGQSIAQQGTLGQGDLALRGRLGEGQLNLGLLGLLQGGDQFSRQLSQQGAQFGQGLDQSGLLGLLGLL